MDMHLWGTFSVADHLRKAPFVADVLLFDRLIVPTPASDDRKHWEESWQPARQRRFLDIIKQEANESRVREIPWGPTERERWLLSWQKKRGLPPSHDPGVDRDAVANAAAFDVRNIKGAKSVDPDAPAYYITRMLLRDAESERNDRLIVEGVPRDLVQIVAAYGTYRDYKDEHPGDPTPAPSGPAGDILAVFAWPFVVPTASGPQLDEGAEEDLLKRAVEFSQHESSQRYRGLFHTWRAQVLLKGRTPSEAAEELAEGIIDYHLWARKQKWRKRMRYAFVVGGGVIGASGALLPLALPAVLPVAVLGAAGAVSPMVPEIWSGVLHRGSAGPAGPAAEAGALFWAWQESLRRSSQGRFGFRPGRL